MWLESKNRSKWMTTDLAFTRFLVPYLYEVVFSTLNQLLELSNDEFNLCDVHCDTDQDSGSDYDGNSSSFKRFNQNELSDLITNLTLL